MSNLGDCFEVHANLFITSFLTNEWEDWFLCHAKVTPRMGPMVGTTFDHCWVEKNGIVKDFANGNNNELPKLVYYGIGGFNDEDVKKFSADEARDMLRKWGHYGPWDSRFPKNK